MYLIKLPVIKHFLHYKHQPDPELACGALTLDLQAIDFTSLAVLEKE